MFLLYYFRLKPTYWWINWWSVLLITSVVSNQMRARRLMTGRRTEYGIKWNILVSRKTSVLEEQALPTEDPFRNSLIGRSAVKNTWEKLVVVVPNTKQQSLRNSKLCSTIYWTSEFKPGRCPDKSRNSCSGCINGHQSVVNKTWKNVCWGWQEKTAIA